MRDLMMSVLAAAIAATGIWATQVCEASRGAGAGKPAVSASADAKVTLAAIEIERR